MSLQSSFFLAEYEAKRLYLDTMDSGKDASEYLSESSPAGWFCRDCGFGGEISFLFQQESSKDFFVELKVQTSIPTYESHMSLVFSL